MHDFIAIGDIVTDAFIRLGGASGAKIEGTPDSESYRISLPFAEKVPYEEVYPLPAVGNAPNAAVSAARLGLSSALVSNLGDDEQGKEALAALTANNVDAKYVRMHVGKKTNYHYVLWYGPE